MWPHHLWLGTYKKLKETVHSTTITTHPSLRSYQNYSSEFSLPKPLLEAVCSPNYFHFNIYFCDVWHIPQSHPVPHFFFFPSTLSKVPPRIPFTTLSIWLSLYDNAFLAIFSNEDFFFYCLVYFSLFTQISSYLHIRGLAPPRQIDLTSIAYSKPSSQPPTFSLTCSHSTNPWHSLSYTESTAHDYHLPKIGILSMIFSSLNLVCHLFYLSNPKYAIICPHYLEFFFF